MQGLILYNGSSKTAKVKDAALKVGDELIKRNVKIQSVKNDDILSVIGRNNEQELIFPEDIKKPDFVIAWDKDIKLIESIERLGIRTFNSSEAIAICDDKALMHSKLINSGIKIPKTIFSPFVFQEYTITKEYYDNIVSQVGTNFILKENKGSFGMQVYSINSYESFVEIASYIESKGFIIQENIKSSKGRDLRVNIVGDEIIGTMLRTNENDFRANITLGGQITMVDTSNEVKDMAMKVHKAFGLGFSGVDILFGENEEPILCEINSNPNFISFEEASGINFAGVIASYIISKMR